MGAIPRPAIRNSISNNHSPWLVPHHYTSSDDDSGDASEATITDRLQQDGGRERENKREGGRERESERERVRKRQREIEKERVREKERRIRLGS